MLRQFQLFVDCYSMAALIRSVAYRNAGSKQVRRLNGVKSQASEDTRSTEYRHLLALSIDAGEGPG